MAKKPGLYANINAKRKRIKQGSGETMRKKMEIYIVIKKIHKNAHTNDTYFYVPYKTDYILSAGQWYFDAAFH